MHSLSQLPKNVPDVSAALCGERCVNSITHVIGHRPQALMVRRSEALPSTIQHRAGIGSTDSVTAHRVNRYLWQVCSDTFLQMRSNIRYAQPSQCWAYRTHPICISLERSKGQTQQQPNTVQQAACLLANVQLVYCAPGPLPIASLSRSSVLPGLSLHCPASGTCAQTGAVPRSGNGSNSRHRSDSDISSSSSSSSSSRHHSDSDSTEY
jgi:hypothetical protein